MKVIKIELETAGIVSSVQIETENNLKIWFDVWENRTYEEVYEEPEITGDWNKYIFKLDNKEDLKIKEFQNNSENFSECLELAINEYEKHKSFKVHGGYTISNTGGYEIEISECGDSARVKDAWGSKNPRISEWLEIEYIIDEDSEPDEEGYKESEPVIDPDGYNIPLNMVMRVNV
tara:strand:+ start:439 stop:966 length:528 start_codon:yes stop_codon:yes gene_type:complete